MKYIDRAIRGFVLLGLLVALSVVPMTGCGGKPGVEISADQAIEVLMSEILEPAAENMGISAFMLSQPLKKGDVVSSESGQTYRIDEDTWFVFIDDDPAAFFAHDCRYVLIDAETGSHEVIDETWPPEINDHSMWDTENLGRGHIVEFYPVLDRTVSTNGGSGQAPAGDYGDAPDGQDDYWGSPGFYPTLYNTANSHFGRPGGHTLNVGEEMLGMHVSAETDANDAADPDGVPNLVDADSDERIFVILDGTQAKLSFTVTVSANAPDVTRYVNALIDFDRDGNWSAGACGTEWVAVNQEVDVALGSSETISTPWFSWGNEDELPSPVWIRLLLDREGVDEALFANVGGWDGSGQFQYGEIEDYLVFLTDQPSPAPTPTATPYPSRTSTPTPPPSGGGVQSPGHAKDPCGDDINYYVITISGGDCAEDLAMGTPAVAASTEMMAGLAGEQGYASMGNLGPGNNRLSDIEQAFDQLSSVVECRDHVLIYICGHGLEGGGITLRNTGGITQEIMTSQVLAGFLSKIPPCAAPNDDCDEPATSCHVTVILESCYAGNFNTPGVTGKGRTVIGTSTDTQSMATYPGGGVYTQTFGEASRDAVYDANDDDVVDPAEADEAAAAAASKYKDKKGNAQAPWESSQECECKCKASIDVEKWVWSDILDDWADETTAVAGQTVRFRLEIENDGESELSRLTVTDLLPSCLEYAGGTTAVIDGGFWKVFAPDEIVNRGVMGKELVWNISEIRWPQSGLASAWSLAPGGKATIEFDAVAAVAGTCVNEVNVAACSADDESVAVSDQDAAAVMIASRHPGDALPEPDETPGPDVLPQPEEVLYAYLHVYTQCTYMNQECVSCTVTASFKGQDVTGGGYPVTNVVLKANGQVLHNSGAVSATLYENSVSLSAVCGQTYNFELIVTDNVGLEGVVTKTIVAEAVE